MDNTKKKHYFLIMIDSLTSFKLLDSIERFKKLNDINSDKNKQVISFFDGFDIKINTLSPSLGTDSGLSGVIGGARHASTNTQLKKINHTMDVFNSAWETVINDFANSDSIDKIYLSWLEYYKMTPENTQQERNFISSKDELSGIKNIHKISFKTSHGNNNNFRGFDSFDEMVDRIDINKNTFSILISDVIHDIYSSYYISDGSWNKTDSLFNLLVRFKNRMMKKGIWNNSQIVITSDHGKRIDIKDDDNTTFYNLLRKVEYKEVNIDYDSNNFNSEKKLGYNEFTSGEQPITMMSSLLFKDFNSRGDVKLDFDNVYMNYDAISILYNSLNINSKNIQFNWYDYIHKKKHDNKIGDINSFLDDPLRIDTSKRILFSMTKNTDIWGVEKSLKYGKNIFIWSKPVFYNKNNNLGINPYPLVKYLIDEKANKSPGTIPKLLHSVLNENNEKDQLFLAGNFIKKVIDRNQN